MRITCVGGGPAGLYFCLLMKLRDPQHDVMVLERNATGATQGWGVGLERGVLEVRRSKARGAGEAAAGASVHWAQQAVHIGGERAVEGGSSIYGVRGQGLVVILA